MINILAPETSSIGTVARKRRRQILQSQRTKATTNEDLTPPLKKKCTALITSSAPRKQSEDRETAAATDTNSTMSSPKESTSPKGKKPQMRYDPEVPMSKEEAAAWRKEQRRKRNRESAAASRQRQRDRISELEEEVNQWKSKYEEALARIEKLEQTRESEAIDCNADPIRSTAISSLESTAVSPCSSPRHNPISQQFPMSNSSCGVVSLQEQNHFEEMESRIACQGIQEQDENVKHLSEKISRPAVKITGATHYTSVPALPTSNQFLPDPCSSMSSNVMPLLDDVTPSAVSPVLNSEENSPCLPDELEFDEFLLDAAEWL